MNKDMKLKKGDTIYYKYNTSIKREEHTNEMPSHSNSPYPGYYPTHTSTMYRKVFKMPKE